MGKRAESLGQRCWLLRWQVPYYVYKAEYKPSQHQGFCLPVHVYVPDTKHKGKYGSCTQKRFADW